MTREASDRQSVEAEVTAANSAEQKSLFLRFTLSNSKENVTAFLNGLDKEDEESAV